MILEAAIGVCIHEWRNIQYVNKGIVKRWFYDISNWPSGGFVWFSQQLRNRQKATKIKRGKVFYGQEPPSGEATTTECGFNYQLLAVIY